MARTARMVTRGEFREYARSGPSDLADLGVVGSSSSRRPAMRGHQQGGAHFAQANVQTFLSSVQAGGRTSTFVPVTRISSGDPRYCGEPNVTSCFASQVARASTWMRS